MRTIRSRFDMGWFPECGELRGGIRTSPSIGPHSREDMPLLSLRDVSPSFGGPRLLDKVDSQVEPAERLCLLGRSGEGKSTLLRLIAGEIEPDEGTIIRQQGLRIARLAQDV